MAELSGETYRRARELLPALLVCDPASRAAFLDRACAGDTELKRELEGLLAVDEALLGRLDQPVVDLLGHRERDTDPREPGEASPSAAVDGSGFDRFLAGSSEPARSSRSRAYRPSRASGRRLRALGAMVAVVAVGAGTVALWVARDRPRRSADQDRGRADAASRVLAEMVLAASSQSEANRIPVPRELLGRGVEALEALEEPTPLRAELMAALGRGFLGHRDLERATPLVWEAYRARRALYGDDDGRVADSLMSLAELETGQSRPAQAEPFYRRALEIERARWGEGHPAVARVLNALGAVAYDQGRCREAEARYRPALAILERWLGDRHIRVAAVRNNLALALLHVGELAEAEHLLRRAVEVATGHLPDADGLVMATRINLASVLRASGHLEEAASLEREVLAQRRLIDRSASIADAAERLARTLLAQGDHAGALRLAREADGLRQARSGDSVHTAGAGATLAEVLLAIGRADEAAARLDTAIATFRRLGLAGHWRALEAESLLGACRVVAGREREGVAMMAASVEQLTSSLGESAPATRAARARLERGRARIRRAG